MVGTIRFYRHWTCTANHKNPLPVGGDQWKMEYVERHDRGYWVSGTRVSLDSVVLAFLQGLSAEHRTGLLSYVDARQVYGAIAYYLGHRAEIDSYLRQADAEFEAWHRANHGIGRGLSEKLSAARRQMLAAS